MKEEIEQIKSKNGNVNLSQKDLLWYLVKKTDAIHDRISCQITACDKRFEKKLDKKVFLWSIGITLTAFIAFIGFVSKVVLGLW